MLFKIFTDSIVFVAFFSLILFVCAALYIFCGIEYLSFSIGYDSNMFFYLLNLTYWDKNVLLIWILHTLFFYLFLIIFPHGKRLHYSVTWRFYLFQPWLCMLCMLCCHSCWRVQFFKNQGVSGYSSFPTIFYHNQ